MTEPLLDDARVTQLGGGNQTWLDGDLIGFPCPGATPGQLCFDVPLVRVLALFSKG